MIPPRNTVAADQQSERRRPERAWTRREYKGRKKPLHRLLIVSIATLVLLVGGGIAAPSTVSIGALQLMLPFFAVLAISMQFVVQMNRIVGANVLGYFMAGVYHRPTAEERIFLFLDLEGFWQPMTAFLDHAVARGTLTARNRALFRTASTGAEALDLIAASFVIDS